jgi:hypothetical protein
VVDDDEVKKWSAVVSGGMMLQRKMELMTGLMMRKHWV